MDVGSLAGRIMSQPVSISLQDGLGFFHHLSLYLPQHALRLACVKGEGMKLPRSTCLTANALGPLYSAGGSVARVGRSASPPNHPLTVLIQASQLLWLVNIHDSHKCSLTWTIVPYPNPSLGWSFQERFRLTASAPFAQANCGALPGRLHTRQGCTLSACFQRVAATGINSKGKLPA
jgi:hypothetical protein